MDVPPSSPLAFFSINTVGTQASHVIVQMPSRSRLLIFLLSNRLTQARTLNV